MAITDKELQGMFAEIGSNWEKFKADHISKVDQLLDLGDRVADRLSAACARDDERTESSSDGCP